MAVDIDTYRARVGIFAGLSRKPKKTKTPLSNTQLKYYHSFKLLGCILQTISWNYSVQQTTTTQHTFNIINLNMAQTKHLACYIILYMHLLLLFSGDVHPNPGPAHYDNFSKDHLSCFFLNARSIKKLSNNKHKLREFKELLHLTNPSILGVSETWLNKSIRDTAIATNKEFHVYRKDRSQRRGGGVLLLVKPYIKSEPREDLESKNQLHNEIIVVEIEPSPGNKIAVITAYRSQKDPFPLFLANLATTLANCVTANLTNILLMGDFNYEKIKWDPNLDTNLPQHCREFIHTLDDYGLHQLNHHPSRRSTNNILDLVLTNFPEKISPIYSDLYSYTSYHFLLQFDFYTQVVKLTQPPRTVYNFKKADYPNIKALITDTDLTKTIEHETTTDNKLTAWLTKLKDIINKNIPKITLKHGYTAPWIDADTMKSIKKKDTKLKQAKHLDTPTAWGKFNRHRNRLKNLIAFKHREYLTNICDSISTNPKRFWSYLKSQTN